MKKSSVKVYRPGCAPKPAGTNFIGQNQNEDTMKSYFKKLEKQKSEAQSKQNRGLSLRKFDTPSDCMVYRQMLTKEVKPRQKITDNTNVEEINQIISELKNQHKFMHHFEDTGKHNTVQQTLAKQTVYITNEALKKQDSQFGYCEKCKKDSYTCWQRKCRDELQDNGGNRTNKIGSKPMVPIDDMYKVLPNYKKSSNVEKSKIDPHPLRLGLNTYVPGFEVEKSYPKRDYNPEKVVQTKTFDNYDREIYTKSTKQAPAWNPQTVSKTKNKIKCAHR